MTRLKPIAFAGFLLLPACTTGSAPSFSFIGAYFPVWMLAAVFGTVAAIVTRVLIGVAGLETVIPWLLAVCSSVGLIVAVSVAILISG